MRFLISRIIYNQYGNDDKGFRIIRTVFSFLMVLAFFMSIHYMNQTEYKEWLIEEECNSIVQLEDLPVDTIQSMNTSLYSLTRNSNPIGTCHLVKFVNENSEIVMELSIYSINEEESVEEAFENIVETKYNQFHRAGNPLYTQKRRRTYMPKVKYDRILFNLKELGSSWNAEKAYVFKDFETDERNILFLMSENQIIVSKFRWNIKEEKLIEMLNMIRMGVEGK